MPETAISTVERPVFVADDGRRARRLAVAARAAAALVAIWACALAAGGVGFARLPALRPVVSTRSGAAYVAARPHPNAHVRWRCRGAAARARPQPCRSVAV